MNDSAIVDWIEKHVMEIACPMSGGTRITVGYWADDECREFTGKDLRDAVRKAAQETAVTQQEQPTESKRLGDLIEQLIAIKDEHGDLPVLIDDADTRGDWSGSEGWNLEISSIRVVAEGEYPESGKRVLIGGDYFDETAVVIPQEEVTE